uniref:Leukocyte-associated Ig-like receptor 1 n=1 Tax=Nannospalax galili TaxID=1026970 RepID=A0A8C6S362_NANGA
MLLHPTTLLVLVLCLGRTVHTEETQAETPILAEPGLTIPLGKSVTFVCKSPSAFELFRLEKGNDEIKNKANNQSSEREARFLLEAVSKDAAGHYHCIYYTGTSWSERSETVELKVTSEDVTQAPAPGSGGTSEASGPKTAHIYIPIGLSVVVILCLFLLLFCLYRHHQKKQELLSSKDQPQRPQERPSPAVNGMERTPDVTKADRLPEDRGTEALTPAVGSPQEVTYAQLDHGALTQREVRAVSLQCTETMSESSAYATIIIH